MPTPILVRYGHRFVQRQTGGAAGRDSRPTAVLASMGGLGGFPDGVVLASMGFRPTAMGGLGVARWVPVGRHSYADANVLDPNVLLADRGRGFMQIVAAAVTDTGMNPLDA